MPTPETRLTRTPPPAVDHRRVWTCELAPALAAARTVDEARAAVRRCLTAAGGWSGDQLDKMLGPGLYLLERRGGGGNWETVDVVTVGDVRPPADPVPAVKAPPPDTAPRHESQPPTVLRVAHRDLTNLTAAARKHRPSGRWTFRSDDIPALCNVVHVDAAAECARAAMTGPACLLTPGDVASILSPHAAYVLERYVDGRWRVVSERKATGFAAYDAAARSGPAATPRPAAAATPRPAAAVDAALSALLRGGTTLKDAYRVSVALEVLRATHAAADAGLVHAAAAVVKGVLTPDGDPPPPPAETEPATAETEPATADAALLGRAVCRNVAWVDHDLWNRQVFLVIGPRTGGRFRASLPIRPGGAPVLTDDLRTRLQAALSG